ncbi:MAG TPA: SAM-dependent chlorinase/fluorinase [Anaerolineaceae bacterium]
MTVITLTTDFGLRDGYDGVLKGVIWSILPGASIADISHTIAPQNILEGAVVLSRAAFYFPPGTVHLAVIDPGVGTARRAIVLRAGEHTFVGPDNGLFTLILEAADRRNWPVRVVHLDKPQYWLPRISRVFHGRDIFAPAAAHLAAGVSLGEIGTPITDPIRLDIPRPARTAGGWTGHILVIDTFGNCSADVGLDQLGGREIRTIRVGGVEIHGMVNAFGDRPEGELIALFDSSDSLSICMVNGSAARRLGAVPGTPIEVYYAE